MYRVLIVDDEPLIRSSLANKTEAFEGAKLSVAGTAANGQKALEWLETHDADICLTDVRMPVMDGLELMREIRERHSKIVPIVVSSYEDFSYVQKSMQLDAVDYILKPVEQTLLHHALARAIRKLEDERQFEANALLLDRLASNRGLLERWVERVRTQQREKIPLLIVDALELFEQWTGTTRFHLLPALSSIWLELVRKELTNGKPATVDIDKSGPETAAPPSDRAGAHRYYRIWAVKRLELGAEALLQASQAVKKGQYSKVVQNIRAYLKEHYAEKISLQEIADHVCMSRTYTANLFKQETGTTVWNYLVEVRMQEARRLLLTTNLKSYEIALRVGYEDSIYFSKLFKKYFGLNPTEYKRRFVGEE